MKKITSLFLIIFIIFVMIFTVNAAENETENKVAVAVSIDGPTSIEIGTKSITLILKLGTFTGIEENKTMGYETVLNYNKDLVKSATVEGLNGWTSTYSKDTQKLIGETDSAKANTQIAKITYQLNDNLTDKTDLEIVFSKFNITDDNLLDQTFDLSKSITIKNVQVSEEQKKDTSETQKQESSEEKETSEAQKQETSQVQNDENLQEQEKTPQISKVEAKKNITDNDNTKTKLSVLPKAGIKTVLIPLIIIIAIIGVTFIARSKSIQLK